MKPAKPKMLYSFYRIGDKLKVRLQSPRMSAAEDRRIQMYSPKVLTTEEAMQSGTYDVTAPLVVMNKAEYDKLAKFIPDPIPANIKVIDPEKVNSHDDFKRMFEGIPREELAKAGIV